VIVVVVLGLAAVPPHNIPKNGSPGAKFSELTPLFWMQSHLGGVNFHFPLESELR